MKAAGSEVLLSVVYFCNVRSQWISQEIQVGFEYIVYESANIKVYPCQVMIRDGLFEETNEQHIFLKYFIIN